MRIRENSAQLLMVEHRPIFASILVGLLLLFGLSQALALIFDDSQDNSVLTGLAILTIVLLFLLPFYVFFVVERTQLILNATDDSLVFRRKNFRKYEQNDADLRDLLRAEIEEVRVNGKPVYRPVLIFTSDAGRAPLPLMSSLSDTKWPKARAVDAINTWLTAHRASLDSATAQD